LELVLPHYQNIFKMTEEKKVEKWGIANIISTPNSTFIHITDITGAETIARYSSGMMTDKDREGGSPYVAMLAAKKAAEEALDKGIVGVHVRIKGKGGVKKILPTQSAVVALQTLAKEGLKIGMIEDITPIPHGYIRPKGGRRGRRV